MILPPVSCCESQHSSLALEEKHQTVLDVPEQRDAEESHGPVIYRIWESIGQISNRVFILFKWRVLFVKQKAVISLAELCRGLFAESE